MSAASKVGTYAHTLVAGGVGPAVELVLHIFDELGHRFAWIWIYR
jgi:hypothetical protein